MGTEGGNGISRRIKDESRDGCERRSEGGKGNGKKGKPEKRPILQGEEGAQGHGTYRYSKEGVSTGPRHLGMSKK